MIFASEASIHEWTDRGAWGKKTLIDYFKKNVAKTPDAVAVVDPPNKEALMGLKPERLTFSEFDKAADATAEALISKGIEKDDIVIVQLPNCWELAMLYIAVTRAGALMCPMPMQWRRSEIEYIGGMAEAKAFITIEEFAGFRHREMIEKLHPDLPSIKHIFGLSDIREMSKGKVTGKLDKIKIDANDAFTLCWSSGTEAKPKGCPMSHNNWICQTTIQYEAAPLEPGYTLITAGPLVNMASIGAVFVPWLRTGGKLVLHHPFDITIFMNQLMTEDVQYAILVPALVNAILKHPKVDQFNLGSLKAISIGAAPPSLWSVREIKKRWGIEFTNLWAQNEGTGLVAGVYEVPDVEMRVDHFPHYGKPNSKWLKLSTMFGKYMQLKLLDPATKKEVLDEGKVGELWYRGPNVIPCYFKRPDITAKSYDESGFFNTGDLFQVKDGDCIGYFDRTKDIIIRGGFNISAQEVESMLLGHPKVLDVAAVAMPDEAMGEKVCIYIVPKGEEKLDLNELKTFMKEKGIAIYKMPERLEIVNVIPRNAVGKIMKNQLRDDIRKKLTGHN